MTLKVLDLFSGIGGFALGFERAGLETIAFCEIDPYAINKLKTHWPNVPIHKDIRELDGTDFEGRIDIVCGGFPCQPFSVAGKQKGKKDNRHLWPEMLRIIKESKPTWVVCENVTGFIKLSLDDVLLDLENEGFTSQSFIIPACAVGGIHRRNRVWVIAHAEHDGLSTPSVAGIEQEAVRRSPKRTVETVEPERICSTGNVAGGEFKPIGEPTQPPVCNRNDGVSDRVARLKALGNAVVPQIPELIGRAITKS